VQELIDIGVNLTHDSFDTDREEVLRRAAAAGVTRMVVTGTSVTSSAQALELAESRPGRLFATAGVHPHHATEVDAHTLVALRALLRNARVVAVGECGLDYFRDYAPRSAQRDAFAAQLELAANSAKPAFLHQRDAHDDFLAILAPVRDKLRGGVAHCFTGGAAELAAYLDLDLHIGVTGWLCDERRGDALRSALPQIPLDRLLIETDAPYLLPRDLPVKPRDRRNEPAFLRHVLERLAAHTRHSVESLARVTTANAERLFGLPAQVPGAPTAAI
jgi:TatD DNase family protein